MKIVRRATAMRCCLLAEKKHVVYDGYFCVRPSPCDIGVAMPNGYKHDEEFLLRREFLPAHLFPALQKKRDPI
jgi:hypothetical protein